MIVLDASVVIAHLDGADAHHRQAVDLLEGNVDEPWGMPELTWAEVLVGPARAGRAEQVLGLLQGWGVEVLHPPPAGPLALAQLRAESGLRMPDCCVLLAALHARPDAPCSIATFDARLAAAAARYGVDVVDAAPLSPVSPV